MKLTRIEIGNYYQFKDFVLDLKYPEDFHDESKAGKPLEKVCFIGQSGTGKTTLINLIQYAYIKIQQSNKPLINDNAYLSLFNLKFPKYSEIKFFFEEFIQNENTIFQLTLNNDNLSRLSIFESGDEVFLDKTKFKSLGDNSSLIGYPTENRTINNIGKGQADTYIFNIQDSKEALNLILQKINEFREKEAEFKINIAGKILAEDNETLKKEYQKWLDANPNPVKDLADNCLDKILNKFHLKTKTELEGLADLNLQIQNIHNNETIAFEFLSTGTKQIIVTAIPLYMLKPENSFVFFDEPERSLFPDLQQILIDYYTSFSPSSQFFFATHSPIIASQFNPAERILLEFDESGNVIPKFGTAPEGDDPNDLLKKDFNLQNVMTEEGVNALHRYIELKTKIKFEKDSQKKEKLAEEFLQLGAKYNFGNEANN
ncbi:MAG: AAA family ATPase [Bacteroidia bacterium]